MAEAATADTVGVADVQIRAQMDVFERDLARVRQLLEKFDTSAQNTTGRVKRFEDASKAAAGGIKSYGQALSDVENQAYLTAAANDNSVKSQAELSRALLKSNEALLKMASTQRSITSQVEDSRQSWVSNAKDVADTGHSYFETGKKILEIAGHLKLAASVAFIASPALRKIVTSGMEIWGSKAAPAVNSVTSSLTALIPQAVKTSAAAQQLTAAASGTVAAVKPLIAVKEAAGLATLAAQFPVVAAGAAALSPALRQVAWKEFKEGAQAVPTVLGMTTKAVDTTAKALTGGSGLSSALGTAFRVITRIALPIGAAVAAFDVLKLSIELGSERIARSLDVIKKSAETGLGIELIQRVEIVAKQMGVSVDSIVASIKKFRDAITAPVNFEIKAETEKSEIKLTSAFQTRLDELVKLGNFANNEFVKAFNSATTAQEKWAAAVHLITRAHEQGQGLAGLNLASTFLSDEVMAKLKAMPDFLQVMQDKADKISQTKIISVEQTLIANEINTRYREAVRILTERWIPYQEKLTELGLKFQALWVGILEILGKALGIIGKLPGQFENFMNKVIDFIPGLRTFTNLLERIGQARPDAADTATPSQFVLKPGMLSQSETAQLLEGLLSPEAIQRSKMALLEFYRVVSTGLKDTSNLLQPKQVDTKAWDRAVASISRHTAMLKADAAAVGRTASFHESMRTELQLLEAAQRSGLGVTQDQINSYAVLRASMSAIAALTKADIELDEKFVAILLKLSDAAGKARGALEVSTLKQDLDFEQKTVFMSDEDVQIAQRLRRIIPDITKALQSGHAAQMRTTNEMRKARELGAQVAQALESGFTGFISDLSRGVSLSRALVDNLNNIAQSLVQIGSKSVFESATKGLDSMIGQLIPGLGGGLGGGLAGIGIGLGMQVLTHMFKDNSEITKKTAAITKKFNEELINLSKTINNEVIGSIQKQADEFTKQAEQIAAEAQQSMDEIAASETNFFDEIMDSWFGVEKAKPKNMKAQAEYQKTLDDIAKFVEKASAKFRESFQTSIESLTIGAGFSSIAQEIEALGVKLIEFIKDTQTAFGGDVGKIQEATAASVHMALSMISGAKAMTETEQEMLRIKTASESVRNVLMEMGLSAEAAGAAIEQHVTLALEKLRQKLDDTFRREMHEMSGFGWINEIGDALTKFAEGQMAGVSPDLLNSWLALTAQKVVDSAQLTGAAFQDLITRFPQLTGLIHEFSAAMDDTKKAAQEAAAAQQKQNLEMRILQASVNQSTLTGALQLFDAKAAIERQEALAAAVENPLLEANLPLLEEAIALERANIIKSFADKAIEEERRAAEERERIIDEARTTLANFARNIRQFIDSTMVGAESPLSPQARLSTAQASFDQQVALIQSGTAQQRREAMDTITQYAQDVLDASKEVFASGPQGQAIFQDVINTLSSLPDQVSIQELILEAITDQTEVLDSSISTLQNTLAAAMDTGDIDQVRQILSAHLPLIDTNTDNSISFDEMKAAFGTNYTDGTLRAVFNKLDTNLDGKISDVELNTQSTADHTTPLPNIETNTDDSASSLAALAAANQLNALANINTNIHNSTGYWAAAASNTTGIVGILNNILAALANAGLSGQTANLLERIRGMTVSQNVNWPRGHNSVLPTNFPIDTFAEGGWVQGGRPGRDSVPIIAMPGEFVVRQPVARSFRSELPAFNASGRWPANDNSEMIKSLVEEITMLRRAVWEAGLHVGERVDSASDKTYAGQKKIADETRHALNRPRGHGAQRLS